MHDRFVCRSRYSSNLLVLASLQGHAEFIFLEGGGGGGGGRYGVINDRIYVYLICSFTGIHG